jgi:hypothetical protein
LKDVDVGVALVDAAVEVVEEDAVLEGVELEDDTAVVDIYLTCYFQKKPKSIKEIDFGP